MVMGRYGHIMQHAIGEEGVGVNWVGLDVVKR